MSLKAVLTAAHPQEEILMPRMQSRPMDVVLNNTETQQDVMMSILIAETGTHSQDSALLVMTNPVLQMEFAQQQEEQSV